MEHYNRYLKYPKEAGFSAPTWGDKRYVWVPLKDGNFISGEVIKELGPKTTVRTDNGEETDYKVTELLPMNPPKFDGVDDCGDLGHLNEPSVFHNLRLRYDRDIIYTYSGLFLVAVNPYKPIPIYTDFMVDLYRGKRRNELAPHIFAISDSAYRAMIADRVNQSLLITGESGAGKTENTKKVIQYLAAIAGRAKQGGVQGELETQLLNLNPLLEAFGNAKTIRNNNSSRFGKFIKLQFNHGGNIQGASLQTYLLEKSRVVYQAPNERTFHIFYQLLKGASGEEKGDLAILPAERFNYLNQSGCTTVQYLDDAKEFEDTKRAAASCGITPVDQKLIFRVVMAILHLSNLPFQKAPQGEGAELKDKESLETAARLLGVAAQRLEDSLIRPRIKAGTEVVRQHLSPEKTSFSRDAMTKALYGRMFLWIVKRINQVLAQERSASFIGVLDIAGFEIFKFNSFEQLCINFTNEKLQQFFNNHMFKLEQEEYIREKINWTFIDFGMDSQAAIDLIEKRPSGILITLDEETLFPKGTDESFTVKLHGHHERNPLYEKPRFKDREIRSFFLTHYAGKVEYTTDQWLEKNKDPLQEDIELCMKSSAESFVADLFSDEFIPKVDASSATGASPVRSKSPSASPSSGQRKGAQFITVAFQYKEQLNSLMTTLQSTSPNFVRCILPNHAQRPGNVEAPVVLEQLRCNGVLEGIRIARKGFPNRIVFAEFVKRYHMLSKDVSKDAFDSRAATEQIMVQLNVNKEQYRIGLTKIFFRAGQLAQIEEQRESKVGQLLVDVQCGARAFIARNMYYKLTAQSQAAKIIQRNLRAFIDLKDWPWFDAFRKVKPLLKVVNFEVQIKEKEQAISQLTRELKTENEKRVALESEIQTLNTHLANTKSKLLQETENVADLEALKEKLTKENTETKRRLEALEADLADETATLNEVNALKKKLDDRVRDLEEQLEDEKAERDNVLTAKKRLEAEHEELRSNLEREQDTREKLEKTKLSLEKQLNDLNTLVDDGNDQIAALEKSKRIVQADLEEIRENLAEEKANNEKNKKKFEAEIKDAKKRIDEEVAAKDALEARVKKLSADLADIQTQLEVEQKNS